MRLAATSVKRAFEPVADFDAHLAILRHDDDQHAVVLALLPELPALEHLGRVFLDRVAADGRHRQHGDLIAGRFLVRLERGGQASRVCGLRISALSTTRPVRNGTSAARARRHRHERATRTAATQRSAALITRAPRSSIGRSVVRRRCRRAARQPLRAAARRGARDPAAVPPRSRRRRAPASCARSPTAIAARRRDRASPMSGRISILRSNRLTSTQDAVAPRVANSSARRNIDSAYCRTSASRRASAQEQPRIRRARTSRAAHSRRRRPGSSRRAAARRAHSPSRAAARRR